MAEANPVFLDSATRGADALYWPDMPIPELRAVIASSPLRPFEQFAMQPHAATQEFREEADRLLDSGWENGGVRISSLRPPLRWTGYDRSFSFHLNAWDPLAILLAAHALFKDEKYFAAAYAIAKHWILTFQRPALEVTRKADLAGYIGQSEEFVWYDMGVGLRVQRMAYVLDVIARDPHFGDDEVNLFVESQYFHHEALALPSFFRSHNNHGFYQALGQLAAARRLAKLPRMADYTALAQKRLLEMVQQQFFDSGVHKEHSPGYHQIVLQTLISARRAELLTADVAARLDQIEHVLSWMVTPDRTLVAFGDTDPKDAREQQGVAEDYKDPGLTFLTSGALIGRPPPFGVVAYRDAGYAFARLASAPSADFRDHSYLAQIAGFHSRTHKHADHLSFVWYDRRRPVLVDPGRYGYAGKTDSTSTLHAEGFWYSDPARVYVETTRAHNAVEIDGKSYSRVKIKPFGSALVYAGEQQGLAVTECDIRHSEVIRHRRILILCPSKFLLVVDWLADKEKIPHDFVQRFHFAPSWTLEPRESGFQAVDTGAPVERICVASLLADTEPTPVARGQTEPDLLGWYSNGPGNLVPASTGGFRQVAVPSARFVTLFVFGRHLQLDLAAQRVSANMTSGRFAWNIDNRPWRLSFDRKQDQQIVASFE